MVQCKGAVLVGTMFLGTPVIATLANVGLVRYGSHFVSSLSRTGAAHAGLMGVVQNVSALAVFICFGGRQTFGESTLGFFKGMLLSHLLAGGALYGLSAAAFKAGIIASSVSLPGAATLILATFAISFTGIALPGVLGLLETKRGEEKYESADDI